MCGDSDTGTVSSGDAEALALLRLAPVVICDVKSTYSALERRRREAYRATRGWSHPEDLTGAIRSSLSCSRSAGIPQPWLAGYVTHIAQG